jgi:hypothetical protein
MKFDNLFKTENRIEIKSVYFDRELSDLLFTINSINGLVNSYPDRYVNSIYYDTVHLKFAKDNLIGLSARKKTRLRFYKLDGNDRLFYGFNFEEKIKNNKLGNKLIYKPVDTVKDTIDLKESLYYEDEDLLVGLHPVSYVKYLRSYYTFNNSVRLTIDQDINFTSLFNEVNLNLNTTGMYFPRIVVEVKFNPDDYNLAKNLLNNFYRAPVRCSKYLSSLAVIGYAQYI